ncbi:Cytochrome P450 [Vigna angularis]|uniref:Cytochrome P450 n=1 Tax=Phaseolus angularis TaxID=3914 RepID=A0A8T0JXJ1_PHAAN|nr:Cytochrome P450 [Vigna angularis]
MRSRVKETLRLHPTTSMIRRESSKKMKVCGPERFMGEEKEFDLRGQNFELMSFGTGRMVCPGASLALQVVTSNLAAMVQCFDWNRRGIPLIYANLLNAENAVFTPLSLLGKVSL